jgi:hypothetical protein
MTSAVRDASARFAAGGSLLACATVLLAGCTGSSGSSAASGPQIGSTSELPYATTACFKRVQMLQISAISPGTGG